MKLYNLFLIPCAICAIFLGYLMVWVNHDTAGLTLLGIELVEWAKFIPATTVFNLYLLDIAPMLAGIALITGAISARARQHVSAVVLGTGMGFASIFIPITLGTSIGEWKIKLLWIALIGLYGIATLFFRKRLKPRVQGVLHILTGALGLYWPIGTFYNIRPAIEQLLTEPIGVGIGVYSSIVGFTLLMILGVLLLIRYEKA